MAIGGGARGVNVHLAPADLVRATGAQVVDITVPDRRRPSGTRTGPTRTAGPTAPATRPGTRPGTAPEG